MTFSETTPQSDSQCDSLSDLVSRLTQSFVSQFSQNPSWIVAAPGRVNLIGEHIDYNDGFVLPMAIERYVVIAAAPRSTSSSAADRLVHVHSVNLNQSCEIDLSKPLFPSANASWTNYIKGVFDGFIQRIGAEEAKRIPAMNLMLESDVPVGGGLSSSAALEVATATLLEAVTGLDLEDREKALLCQNAEHVYAGVPCGIMDQFSSVFGKKDAFILLDCRSQELRHVPFAGGGISILITNSNVKHELSGGEYAQRRTACDRALQKIGVVSWRDVDMPALLEAKEKLTEVEFRRALHVVSEIDRTAKAATAIECGDWAVLGKLMYESHHSLRHDYEVSCEELDILVELASELGIAEGIYGSRMTGGGFGGCTVTLIESSKVASASEKIANRYQQRTGIAPQRFASRPAQGAQRIR